tara:strand:+ start:2967 stop:3227 length:261 start_codon:yes stop_codon:yes gene_type:complete
MLKTISIIFFIYLLIKYLGRILVPILLKRFANKMKQRFQNKFNEQFNQQANPSEKEGDLSIKRKSKRSKVNTNDIGEYVDFEEVDD